MDKRIERIERIRTLQDAAINNLNEVVSKGLECDYATDYMDAMIRIIDLCQRMVANEMEK